MGVVAPLTNQPDDGYIHYIETTCTYEDDKSVLLSHSSHCYKRQNGRCILQREAESHYVIHGTRFYPVVRSGF